MLEGSGREVVWEALEPAAIAPRGRRLVGNAWLARMKQEHLAVGVFAGLTRDLACEGCDPAVLALVSRAASDEVRHAQLCGELAARLLGAGVSPLLRGLARIPAHPGCSGRERALLHLVEMCCLNETFTGTYLTEMLARATHPVSRAVVQSLLTDEIDHGRVGWAHLCAACGEGWGGALVAAALPAMLDRTVGPVMQQAVRWADLDDPQLEALGYLGTSAAAELYRATLHQVILPGLEMAGVDPGAATRHARDRGWL
jgi:hypothetical protein